MEARAKLSPEFAEALRCPACGGPVALSARECPCTACGRVFPVIQGIPVLIDDSASLFSIADFLGEDHTTWQPTSPLRKSLSRLLPNLSKNMKARENYSVLAKLLLQDSEGRRPKVLVIGGSRVGQGMDDFVADPRLQLLESDVSFGVRTSLICDAHRLPLADDSVDAVVIQAVLQALVDPEACVRQIHRVLAPRGLVYAETPFMQQVFGARYDFTRFTHLGHRRLFRDFEEVGSGAVCGPGMALAWSYQYFLLSFFKTPALRTLVKGFARLTAFWVKYIDRVLIDRPEGSTLPRASTSLGARAAGGSQTGS